MGTRKYKTLSNKILLLARDIASVTYLLKFTKLTTGTQQGPFQGEREAISRQLL